MPRVFEDDDISQREALLIYQDAARRCGDTDWRQAHPLAYIASLVYSKTTPERIKLDAAKEALKYVMAEREYKRSLIIDQVPLNERFPMLEILLNAPQDSMN